ncbi:hypothetical protein [Streptomyces mirabilis]|uniref:hypothetical protein n=1 Tax=Streptomyces mirabilis TaxID=68239 RepID=UPI0033224279
MLYDLCVVPFDGIGRILGQFTDATKMVVGRARREEGCGRSSGRRREDGTPLSAIAFTVVVDDGRNVPP